MSNNLSVLKIVQTVGGLVICFWLSACSPPQTTSIRFGLAVAPITLDPRFATDAASMRVNRLLYRALTDFDEKLQPMPELATWELLNPTLYRFRLGQAGRDFHDGTRLSAQDVQATYEFILDEKNASPHRSSLKKFIKQISVLDADTIEFQLHKPDPIFPGRLTVGIVPASLIHSRHPLNKSPVGSGTFQLVAWPVSSYLSLQRRSDGQRVDLLEVKDPVVRVLKLLRGEVDLLQNDLSPELITWLMHRPEVQITQGEGAVFTYLGFNLQDSVMRQRLVREAVAYAINREEIIHYLMGDAARLANNFLLPATHWAALSNFVGYSYQPEKSRQLLATAGYSPEHPLHLTYKTSNHPVRVRIASVIQQQLAEVGIQLDLRSYDWGTFYGDIKSGRFQVFSLSWIGVKMPDIYRYAFHSQSIPPTGANRGRLQNAEIDALIEQAEEMTTVEEQAALYQKLQSLLIQELPYVPLWYEDNVLVMQKRVTGYRLARDGNYDGLIQVVIK